MAGATCCPPLGVRDGARAGAARSGSFVLHLTDGRGPQGWTASQIPSTPLVGVSLAVHPCRHDEAPIHCAPDLRGVPASRDDSTACIAPAMSTDSRQGRSLAGARPRARRPCRWHGHPPAPLAPNAHDHGQPQAGVQHAKERRMTAVARCAAHKTLVLSWSSFALVEARRRTHF
ncbi:hypothetical protein PVAP13_8NG318768 [Panicum virgatum]|uniref:Uncharacterized protein n=1 Tax=Panicum virgatum TaxID=38727 RepID=A0A8T0PA55_PANVG|nr:hypothetical protein PVAP13_8NG318768 [Panicum virgatum]